MGIAWFDDEPPPMEEPTLRIGGIPLLTIDQAWPICSRCGLPMLFRAQVPMALTSLVSPFDDRLLHFFECHANLRQKPCDSGSLVIANGNLLPRTAPECHNFDVVLISYGNNSKRIREVVESLRGCFDEEDSERVTSLFTRKAASRGNRYRTPTIVLNNVPSSIGNQAVHTLNELGAIVELIPVSPTTLPDIRGGKLVPFDDGSPGVCRTSLPEISRIQSDYGVQSMRGLIGGAAPGYRDYAFTCNCGRRTRTAVRLLADASVRTLSLGPATAQICLHCGSGSLFRSV